MIRRTLPILACAIFAAFTAQPVRATDVNVAAVLATRSGTTVRVEVDVSWRNGWRNAKNHDAGWLFVKLKGSGPNWSHARVLRVTLSSARPASSCAPSGDSIGVFCSASAMHRGDVAFHITLDVQPLQGFPATGPVEAEVYGLEMVYVADGAFTIGDSDTASVLAGAFYRSNANGSHAGTLRITTEAAIDVAPKDGALYYRSRTQYDGDMKGPVPAAFPKGTRAFYTMKYEILQGQYATFLNNIRSDATYFRAPNAGRGYSSSRGTIRLDGDRYVADKPNRPANWISWDDGVAFADWAGLRPMTELEFTKAARGPVEPIARDYPWGTSSKERLLRRMGPDDDLVTTGAASESLLTDDNRDVFGASYWWVMDLGGSVWEKVVTIGHPRGRAFRGTHGDGMLREYGMATNEDWPVGDHEAGGYGYRGGGYYERGMVERELNPYSIVEHRPYGSWGGGPRSIAYGFRAVRTADAR